MSQENLEIARRQVMSQENVEVVRRVRRSIGMPAWRPSLRWASGMFSFLRGVRASALQLGGPQAVAIGDINGGGRNVLAVSDNDVSVFLNNG